MNRGSTKDQKEIEIETFIGSEGGSCKEVKAERVAGPETLLGSVNRMLWGFQAKARLVNTTKELAFGNPLRGITGKALGCRGDCLSQGLLWKS